MKKILLSGIQPSGNIHIGNYLGALKPWAELQAKYRLFAMIADLHAITVPQDPQTLRAKTLELARLLVAVGIDPERSVIFVQSHVPAHTELGWILNTLTPVGELERMTQYKEKREKTGTMAGLLTYPTLMAADILLYQASAVPVGEDQLQHLELVRTLARRFNNRFGKMFTLPRPIIQKDTARVMGLDDPTKKMSKSAANSNNYIALLDPPAEIRRKIKIAVTDSGKEVRCDEKQKPAISNLIRIYGAFSDLSCEEIERRYAGKGYAAFKSDLAEILAARLGAIQQTYRDISEKKIIETLHDGAETASAAAAKTLREVKTKTGFLLRSSKNSVS